MAATKPKAVAKRGRPTDFNETVALTICERIASGESVREIGRDEAMPTARTIHNWVTAHPEFFQQYTRAREAQADTLAEEIIGIADDADPTLYGISKATLRIEARKWYAGKVRPKVYGETKGPAVAVQINNDARAFPPPPP